MQPRRSHPHLLLAPLLAGLMLLAIAGGGGAQAGSAPWRMENCHGLAPLVLAPLNQVQATLPPGYEAQDAATFLLPGAARSPLGDLPPGAFGLVGVEVWRCASITLGGTTAKDTVYGSAAAVVEQPPGAPGASLYFYKYENFFGTQALVSQSERLGAPASLVVSSNVASTGQGATGTLTLASGATYTLATADLGDMSAGSFQEWHHGSQGVSNWFAGYTVSPGKQGTGDLTVPGGSAAARAMGGTAGNGLGIHTTSTFSGGVQLTR